MLGNFQIDVLHHEIDKKKLYLPMYAWLLSAEIYCWVIAMVEKISRGHNFFHNLRISNFTIRRIKFHHYALLDNTLVLFISSVIFLWLLIVVWMPYSMKLPRYFYSHAVQGSACECTPVHSHAEPTSRWKRRYSLYILSSLWFFPRDITEMRERN